MSQRTHQRGADHRSSSMGAGQGSGHPAFAQGYGGHSKAFLEPPSGSPFGSPRVGLQRKCPRGLFPWSSFCGPQRKRTFLSKRANRSNTHERGPPERFSAARAYDPQLLGISQRHTSNPGQRTSALGTGPLRHPLEPSSVESPKGATEGGSRCLWRTARFPEPLLAGRYAPRLRHSLRP